MSVSRHLLLISLLSASSALTGVARADTITEQKAWPEAGSWGQAWGDDDPAAARPSPQPPVRQPSAAVPAPGYVPPPPAAALPSRTATPMAQPVQAGAGTAPLPSGEMGQAYPETGSWGQAWGDEDSPAPLPPRSTAIPSTIVGAPPRAAAEPPSRRVSTGTGSAAADPAITMTRSPRRAERPAIITREEDDEGDAVGLNRPPRIVPRPLRNRDKAEEAVAPVRMIADQVIYDREFNVVTAKGRVEMVHDNRTISADSVSYNLKLDVMGASGNVVLTEPSGEITHADYFELTGDFKNGVAREIRAILADNSRLAAQSAQRVGGDRTDFDRAVYTACEPCRDNPDRVPLWQMKAERVTHNQAEAQIEYRDVWLEFAGLPVAYTPYMSHPDPTVKRQSGFLAPTFGMNSTLGPSITTPYFAVLSDGEDVTLAPRFMLDQFGKLDTPSSDDAGSTALKHVQLSGQHRWRGLYGESKTQGSITADKTTGDIRGHLESKGMVELDSTWRAGWQIQHESDQTYRQLYHVRMDEDRPWLTTRPYVEGFGRRNYAMVESLSFEGPRVVEDASKAPVVLPHMLYKSISAPGWGGSYWTSDSDMLAYTRTVGPSAQRLSSRVAWNLPLISPIGEVYTISTGVRGDGYRTDHVGTSRGDNNIGRVIPEMTVNWRMPFSRTGTSISQVIEPMAMVAVSPVGGNDSRIPNEDSLDFELDETNVFRANRLPGLDRVEGGARGAYGLRWAAYPAKGGSIVAQAAQGWRAHPDSTYGVGSGFANTLSDYVGRIDVTPSPSTLSFHNRTRLDKDTFEVRRNEAGLSIGPPALNLGSSYGMLAPTAGGVYPKRQYISYSAASQFSQFWRSSFSIQQDLANSASGGGTVNWVANAMYSDECFAVIGTFNRYHTDVPGLLSGYTMMLTVVLKSLGEAPVSVF